MKPNKLIPPLLTARPLKRVWNIISANIGWLACVFGAASGHHWLGLLVVGILFVIHITAIERHRIRLIFSVAFASVLIGFLTDTALILLGTVEPNRWFMPAPFTTLWDLVIWANFSLTLNMSLRFLQKRPFSAAVLGALCAPGTYYAAGRLGALHFSEPVFFNLVWVGVLWLLAMPCLSLAARYFYRPPKTNSAPV
ncbi:MAG: DUF2878 domain-containing protein [Planctomycetota bacterium]|jgi:hypothetical protein